MRGWFELQIHPLRFSASHKTLYSILLYSYTPPLSIGQQAVYVKERAVNENTF
jgi:hypothetical protein